MYNQGYKGFNKALSPCFWGLGAYCILFTIVCFITNRSLRLDEAMFAQTILTRDVNGILQGNFDYGQSGSLGFIIIIKYLTVLFGNSEMVLRSVSFIAYFLNILLALIFCKRIFGIEKSSIAFALFAGLWCFTQYAVDFKPYSFDITLSLLVVLLYDNFRRGHLNIWLLCLIYSFLVWFSFATLFILGAICIYYFITRVGGLKRKDINWQSFIFSMLPLGLILISVAADYFLWVKPTSQNVPGEANEYWKYLAFPLIPKGLDDIKLLLQMFRELFLSFGTIITSLMILPFFLYSLWYNRKKWITAVLAITSVVVVLASSIGMYPISLRLQLFLLSFYILYSSSAMELAIRNIARNRYTLMVVVAIILIPILFGVISRYKLWDKEVFYYEGEESRQLLDYYNGIKTENSRLWVSSIAQPACAYYFNYPFVFPTHNDKLIEKDNVIWGSTYRIMKNSKAFCYSFYKDEMKFEENINAITSYSDVYLIRVHSENEVYDWVVDELKKHGDITPVMEFKKSILYHYTKQQD